MIRTFLLACCGLLLCQATAARAQADSTMAFSPYAPGARSSASANGVLDSVIGEHPPALTTLLQPQGHRYYLTSDGKVLNEDHHPLAASQPLQDGPPRKIIIARQKAPDAHLTLEPVEISVVGPETFRGLPPPATRCSRHAPLALLWSTIGPSGVFIAPQTCLKKYQQTTSLVHATADDLAAYDANPYLLAGNYGHIPNVRESRSLPDDSAVLIADDQPKRATP